MIEQLMVKDYILFDSALIDFPSGMSVITGETGAGKSLLIDAIGYLSGNRIYGNIVRVGKTKCTLQMVLSCDEPIKQVLEENDFEAEDSIIITRIVHANQKSTIRINQQITTLSFVRDLVAKMVDVHSQMDTFQLMKLDVQMELLDNYAKVGSLKRAVHEAYFDYKAVADELDTLENETLSDDELAYMTAQYNQIEQADIQPGELESLQEKIKELTDISNHLETFTSSVYLIQAENGLMDRMYELYKNLNTVQSKDGEDVHDMYYRLDEIKASLQDKIDDFDSRVQDLDWYNAREYEIRNLFKKHGGSYESMMEKKHQYMDAVERILHREHVLERLKKDVAAKKETYLKLAEQLSAKRVSCFSALAQQVETHCHDLMLEHARFKIDRKEKKYAKDGIDAIEFLVSMNPGQPFSPLKDSASGGELSRLMLALKVVFQSQKGISTLIFDEIDTGISGKVSYAMGQKINALAQSYQVLCITHASSVAAWAHTHFRVWKESNATATETRIEKLDDTMIVEELALMTSGKLTDASIQAARELKERIHG